LAEYPKVNKLDMAKYLCDEDYCDAENDGMLYGDDNHLSKVGSLLMTPHLHKMIFSQ
jgi:hypothetical protein